MLKRTISGAIITLIMLLAVIFSGVPFVLNSVMALITAIGMYEMLKACGVAKHKGLTAVSVLFAGAFVFCSEAFCGFRPWLTAATVLLVFAAFTYYLKNYGKITLNELIFALAMTLIIPYFFSTIVLVRAGVQGLWHLVLIFVLSWIPDTGAYLCGSAFGKHKLAPVVSPNKTMEGVLGGLIASVVGMLIYGLIMQLAMDYRVNYALAILYGVAGSLAGVFGDLCFSIIKRQTGIKDYGNLIPGHGGILDRFDSMMTVAPLIEALLILLPLAEEVW